MSARRFTATARAIENVAVRHHIVDEKTATDGLAFHITRLAGDDVHLDEVELMLVGLQRAGRINRKRMVRLQARYLRESRP